jgi:magnesium-transporting ATPase (P-type)
MSQIEVKVNSLLGIILLLQLVLCLIVGIISGIFISSNRTSHYYIAFGDNSTGLEGFLSFCTYFVLINTMIPISLIVSI